MFDAFAAGPRFTPTLSASLKIATAALAVVALAGCAQQQSRSYRGGYSSKEYFPEGKYGKASPRVVLMGEDVPKGGGRYLVGRPYRIAGRTYVPSEKQEGYSVTGTASWYGAAFHGRRTANGEIYDMASLTAAHPTMPLPSYARVTNLRNGKSIVVRVNDRGPYHGGRVMDMSSRVADLLEFKGAGTARVKVDYLGRAGLAGSDDRQLAATLTTGAPAQLAGYETAVEASAVATREPAPEPRAPEPARRAPLTPAQSRAPSEDEALAFAETPAPPASRPLAPAPRPRVETPSKPRVLSDEFEETAQAASEEIEESVAPPPRRAPLPPRRPSVVIPLANDAEHDVPTPPRRGVSAGLYYAADASLAARFQAPGQPFSQLRGVTGESRR